MRLYTFALLLCFPCTASASAANDFLTLADPLLRASSLTSCRLELGHGPDLPARFAALLRSAIKPHPLQGFKGPGLPVPEFCEEIGFDHLYGIQMQSSIGNDLIVLSTVPLLKAWLARQKLILPGPAITSVSDLTGDEAFFFHAISLDASIHIFARLLTRYPPASSLAAAFLVEQTQDVAIGPPDRIAVILIKGDRVYVGLVQCKTSPPQFDQCTSIWNSYEEQANGPQGDRARIEAEGEKAYRSCWVAQAQKNKILSAMKPQAQSLLDALAR